MEIVLQAVKIQPIQANAPKLPVSGLFHAHERIVQIAKIADRCTGIHRMAKILAGTLPGIGLSRGWRAHKTHGSRRDPTPDCRQEEGGEWGVGMLVPTTFLAFGRVVGH